MSIYLFDKNGNPIGTVETNEELAPDYKQFYDDLLVSTIYGDMMRSEATANQARAITVFASQIDQAMSGRENRGALQGAIWLLLAQITLTPAHIDELATMMTRSNLAGIYTLAPPEEVG